MSLVLEQRKMKKKPRDAVRPTIQAAIDAGDAQKVYEKLTEKQRRFCEEYIVDFNGAGAILRAGFETKYANRMATQLLQHPGCKFVIDKLIEDRAENSKIKPDYVISKVVKTIEKAEARGNYSAILRGCELLARHLGMFVERTEISGPNGEAIKYERVKEAADAFTSSIASLIERGTTGGIDLLVESRDESRA